MLGRPVPVRIDGPKDPHSLERLFGHAGHNVPFVSPIESLEPGRSGVPEPFEIGDGQGRMSATKRARHDAGNRDPPQRRNDLDARNAGLADRVVERMVGAVFQSTTAAVTAGITRRLQDSVEPAALGQLLPWGGRLHVLLRVEVRPGRMGSSQASTAANSGTELSVNRVLAMVVWLSAWMKQMLASPNNGPVNSALRHDRRSSIIVRRRWRSRNSPDIATANAIERKKMTCQLEASSMVRTMMPLKLSSAVETSTKPTLRR